MKQHITVNGTPWCQCSSRVLPPAENVAMLERAFAQGVFLCCMDSMPSDEGAIKFLNANGVPAVLTDGPCPTLLEALE